MSQKIELKDGFSRTADTHKVRRSFLSSEYNIRTLPWQLQCSMYEHLSPWNALETSLQWPSYWMWDPRSERGGVMNRSVWWITAIVTVVCGYEALPDHRYLVPVSYVRCRYSGLGSRESSLPDTLIPGKNIGTIPSILYTGTLLE
jgi:hypothetical protein